MKRIASYLALIIVLTSCNTGSERGSSNSNTEKKLEIENSRFNYSFTVPSQWNVIDSSDNGDGYFINTGNASTDVRIYALMADVNEMDRFEGFECDKKTDFRIGDQMGSKCMNKNERVYTVDYNDKRVYIYAHADESWITHNESVLEALAKSVRVTD